MFGHFEQSYLYAEHFLQIDPTYPLDKDALLAAHRTLREFVAHIEREG
jgi:hypothetical protein